MWLTSNLLIGPGKQADYYNKENSGITVIKGMDGTLHKARTEVQKCWEIVQCYSSLLNHPCKY